MAVLKIILVLEIVRVLLPETLMTGLAPVSGTVLLVIATPRTVPALIA